MKTTIVNATEKSYPIGLRTCALVRASFVFSNSFDQSSYQNASVKHYDNKNWSSITWFPSIFSWRRCQQGEGISYVGGDAQTLCQGQSKLGLFVRVTPHPKMHNWYHPIHCNAIKYFSFTPLSPYSIFLVYCLLQLHAAMHKETQLIRTGVKKCP